MRKTAALSLSLVLSGCSLLFSSEEFTQGDPKPPEVPGDDGGVDAAPPPADAQADADAAAPTHLVGAWSFEQAVADVVPDTSGNDHNGRLGAGARVEPSDFSGNALYLGGGIDAFYVESLNGAKFPRSGTLSIHLEYDFQDTTNNRGVFENYGSTEHLFFRRAPSVPAGEFQVAFQRASTAYAFVHDFTLLPNAWQHVVITWSEVSQLAAIYVNKILVTSEPYDAPWAPEDQIFRLGDDFIGHIDEVRLYDVALSKTEIEALP